MGVRVGPSAVRWQERGMEVPAVAKNQGQGYDVEGAAGLRKRTGRI